MPISMLLSLQGQSTGDEEALFVVLIQCFCTFILFVPMILGLWKVFTELARKAQVLQPWDIRASRASAAFGVAIACTE